MFGQLIDFGHAPFDFNDDNDMSFYIKLSHKGDTKTSWSIGYGDAIQSSNINVGDWVLFDFIRKEAVQTKRGKKHRSIFSATKCEPPAYATKTNVQPSKTATTFLTHPTAKKAKGDTKPVSRSQSIVDNIAKNVAEKHGVDFTSPDEEPALTSQSVESLAKPPREEVRESPIKKKVKTPFILKVSNTLIISLWIGFIFLAFSVA